MGACLSVSDTESSDDDSVGCGRPARARRKMRKRQLMEVLAAEAKSNELLYRIPGRMCGNGSSSNSCIFTQQGRKGINQDAMIVWENFASRADTTFCGVFDGHGPFGHLVARKVRDTLPSKLSAFCKSSSPVQGPVQEDKKVLALISEQPAESLPTDGVVHNQKWFTEWKEHFLTSYNAMDKELKTHPTIDCFCSGTTAVTVILQGQDMVVANVGDSRAVLGTLTADNSSVEAIQLTVDLKPNLPLEAERIKRCKGRVFALEDEPEVARVWLPYDDSPGLAMARAFGDFCLKDFGLIAVPEITYTRLTDRDQFIVLASDGIWDVLTNKEVVETVWEAPTRTTAARALVETAVRAWRLKYPTSKVDDCAVVCLYFNKQRRQAPSIFTATSKGLDAEKQMEEMQAVEYQRSVTLRANSCDAATEDIVLDAHQDVDIPQSEKETQASPDVMNNEKAAVNVSLIEHNGVLNKKAGGGLTVSESPGNTSECAKSDGEDGLQIEKHALKSYHANGISRISASMDDSAAGDISKFVQVDESAVSDISLSVQVEDFGIPAMISESGQVDDSKSQSAMPNGFGSQDSFESAEQMIINESANINRKPIQLTVADLNESIHLDENDLAVTKVTGDFAQPKLNGDTRHESNIRSINDDCANNHLESVHSEKANGNIAEIKPSAPLSDSVEEVECATQMKQMSDLNSIDEAKSECDVFSECASTILMVDGTHYAPSLMGYHEAASEITAASEEDGFGDGEEETEGRRRTLNQHLAGRSTSRRSLAECLSVADEEEWSALDGVARVNSLLNLPRFLTSKRFSNGSSWMQAVGAGDKLHRKAAGGPRSTLLKLRIFKRKRQ